MGEMLRNTIEDVWVNLEITYIVIYHVEIHPVVGEIQKVGTNKGIDGVWNLDGSQFTTAWNMEREDLQLHSAVDVDKSPVISNKN